MYIQIHTILEYIIATFIDKIYDLHNFLKIANDGAELAFPDRRFKQSPVDNENSQ